MNPDAMTEKSKAAEADSVQQKKDAPHNTEAPLVITPDQYPIIVDSLRNEIAENVKRTVDAYITNDELLKLTHRAELNRIISNGLRTYVMNVYFVATVRLIIIVSLTLFLFIKGILHEMPIFYVLIGVSFYVIFEIASVRSIARLADHFIAIRPNRPKRRFAFGKKPHR